MEQESYTNMRKAEDQHWWYRGRREIFSRIISSFSLSDDAKILDAGCGTGGNLKLLAKFGVVTGVEFDESARDLANERNIAQVLAGSFPKQIPNFTEKFELITMFDVLEHLDEDFETLVELRQHLKPGGVLLISVPAFMFLWSQHDERLHHKRRYQIKQLVEMAERAGFKIVWASYFNFFLFPLAILVRFANRLGLIEDSKAEEEIPPMVLNKVLFKIFSMEKYFLGKIRLFTGLSLVAVLKVKE